MSYKTICDYTGEPITAGFSVVTLKGFPPNVELHFRDKEAFLSWIQNFLKESGRIS